MLFRILLSAEEDKLSPFDSKIACLCQSIEINNNKYVYRQSQVRMPNGSGVRWAECLLIIGTGCRVQVFSLILDSSVGLSAGIQSAEDWVSETPWVRILLSAEEDKLSPFDSKIACLCQSIEINNNKYHNQIGSINLTHYYILRGCVPEMFVTSYAVTYCIYIPGKPGFCFHYYCAVYDECKYSDTFWLADRVRLFAHYTISLSSLCKFMWRHWTYKISVRYILSSVWVRSSIFFSIIHYTIYGAVCFQFTLFPCDEWENIHFVLLSSRNR